MVEEIDEYLASYGRNRQVRALKARPDFIERLQSLYPNVLDAGEIAYLYVNNITERPICPNCGASVSWFKNRYAKFCSKTCANAQNGNIGKMQETMQNRHGVTNSAHVPGVNDRRRQSMLQKYGSLITDKHVSKLPETAIRLNKKGRETIKTRYGVENSGQIPGHAEKIKNTMLGRYGVDHQSKLNHVVGERRLKAIAKINTKLPTGSTLIDIHPPDRARGEVNHRYEIRCECGRTETFSSETFKFRLRKMEKLCSTCTGISTARSIKETELCNFIESIVDGAVIHNDRKLIWPYELDVVVPHLRVAVEFCGLFWHSEINKEPSHHKDKLDACRKAGIRLITVFEDEWDYRKDVVCERLRHIMGASDVAPVYARKCRAAVVSTKLAREFCERYHVQGYAPSAIKIGLWHDAELVAVMTFARPTAAKGRKRNVDVSEWELSRFCSRGRVVGAATKLFKKFVSEYDAEFVVTYSDLRWNTGVVYEKMGFQFKHESRPNYWYIDGNRRIHRFALRKNSSDDQNLTEWENRQKQGWRRIWDCGNSVWEWRREP